MNERLIACVACHRHVKENDAVCPFCGAAAPVAPPLPASIGVRMTRALMMAAGTAGTVAAIIDCGQTSSVTAFYGVGCTGDACISGGDQDAAPPLVLDGGSGVAFYGVGCTGDACGPIIEDAGGEDVDAADASNADGAVADGAARDGEGDAQDASALDATSTGDAADD